MSSTNGIDIEKIMDEIRDDIKKNGYSNDVLSFSEATEGCSSELCESAQDELIKHLNVLKTVQAYRPLNSNGIKGFIKKALRKMIKFYIEPIVSDQNAFNACVTDTCDTLSKQICTKQSAEMLNYINKIVDENERLRVQTKENSKAMAELSERLKTLENKS